MERLFFFLLVTYGVNQILTVSRLFQGPREMFKLWVTRNLSPKSAGLWKDFIGCPMCMGLWTGMVLSLLMGVQAPVSFGEGNVSGVLEKAFLSGVSGFLGVFLMGAVSSGVSYFLTMTAKAAQFRYQLGEREWEKVNPIEVQAVQAVQEFRVQLPSGAVVLVHFNQAGKVFWSEVVTSGSNHYPIGSGFYQLKESDKESLLGAMREV